MLLETGLRAVDLLTPIPAGADVLICGDPRAGVRLLGQELAHRLASLPSGPLDVEVWIDEGLAEADKLLAEIRESSPLLRTVEVVSTVPWSGSGPGVKGKGKAAFALAAGERFLAGFRESVRAARRSLNDRQSLSSFAVCEGRIEGEFDVRMVSSRPIAAEAVFPALDPRKCTSAASDDSAVGEARRRTAGQVGAAVAEVLENLYEGAVNDPQWFFNTDPGGRAAVQLLCFFGQPYFVAEPYTGMKGQFISADEAVRGFAAILDGRFSHLMPRELRFRNGLD